MKKIIAATIGSCVHVAGTMNFLSLAEKEGYETKFLGAAVDIDSLIEAVKAEKPDYVGVSYRLTPEPLRELLKELKEKIHHAGLEGIRWLFGGTQPTAMVAQESGVFFKVFDGHEDVDEILGFLRGKVLLKAEDYPRDVISRIKSKYPYPILRHHLGLPSLEATLEAVRRVAESKVLDVISVAPDQNAQEHFFEQHKMDARLDGAGGVPLRTEEDFRALYDAAQRGNYPLLRCYSGTNHLIDFARLLQDTINNAWCAVPLCWYNALDRRGPRAVDSIRKPGGNEWHGQRESQEVNEAPLESAGMLMMP